MIDGTVNARGERAIATITSRIAGQAGGISERTELVESTCYTSWS